MAIKQCVDINDKDRSFITTLEKIHSILEKPTKKRKKETELFKMSDKNIFEQRILPQIREKLAEYERLEKLDKTLEWKIKFDFVKDYETLNIDDLKLQHAVILETEITITSLDLVVKFYRGLIYFRAREISAKEVNIKSFFQDEFGIGYNTAIRYMIFSSIIKRYPRLMICRLSYTQIMKHQKRLFDTLKGDLNLHDRLSQSFSVTVENKVVKITPSDISVPVKRFNVNPDFIYEDFFNNNDGDKSEDKEFEDWFKEMNESHEIFNNTDDADDLELEKELADKAKIN